MKINIIEITKQKYTPNDLAIIEFINCNPEKCAHMTINGLARVCHTSPASITRLLKKTAFSSYRDLQIYISNRNHQIASDYQIKQESTINDIAINIRSCGIYAINETFSSMDYMVFTNLIESIDQSEKIFVFALGSSFMAAQELCFLLQRIGMNAWPYSDFHRAIESIVPVLEKCLVVIISESCKTHEIINFANSIKARKIKIALITANEKSAIDTIVNIKLLYKKLEPSNRISSISSVYSQFYIVHLCYAAILNRHSEIKTARAETKQFIDNWNKGK